MSGVQEEAANEKNSTLVTIQPLKENVIAEINAPIEETIQHLIKKYIEIPAIKKWKIM
tara:strand:+ start:554 stop:727 length:174 start_codon:yes stop_codon:yes gene_type:complete